MVLLTGVIIAYKMPAHLRFIRRWAAGAKAASALGPAVLRRASLEQKVTEKEPSKGEKLVFGREGLQALINALAADGFRVLGPMLRDGAIVYDDVSNVSDMPSGYVDQPGCRPLSSGARLGSEALFSYAAGPQSWKAFLFPPRERLWSAKRDGESFSVIEQGIDEQKLAFVGVRSCDLHAIAIQDKVFCEGPFKDVRYEARRRSLFTVAVNCAEPGGTCFCASMDTGPAVKGGFDIALTELIDGDGQRFVVEVGTAAGAKILDGRPGVVGEGARSAARRRRRWSAPPAEWGGASTRRASRKRCRARRSIRNGTTSPSAASPARTARWSVPHASALRSRTTPTWRE